VDTDRLRAKRVVVVGASSGVGRGIAENLVARGARVVFAARRKDVVERLAAAAGGGAIGLSCDVCDEGSCEALVAGAVERLGGLDGLVYSPAIIQFGKLADIDAATWEAALRTNVVGAALVTKFAVPHLRAAAGRAIYLSSVSASSTPPWTGLGVYIVSKAALDKLVAAWRADEPGIGFTRLALGPVEGVRAEDDPVNAGMTVDAGTALAWTARHIEQGYMTGATVTTEDTAEMVATILASRADVDSVTLEAR